MDEDNGAFENSKIIRSIWKNTFDKILEIKVSNKRTLKEMKTKIMEEEKKKIENKYQKEYNDAFIKKKIEISSTKNNANLLKMKTKNELVTNIINETLNKLKTFASPTNKEYKDLLKELIVESMVKMLETQAYIQCRESDKDYIKSILTECENLYEEIMKKETKREYKCKLIIDEKNYFNDELGGIKLLNSDKKIILNNGLKDRLMLSKEQNLPTIKKMLFPK